MRFQMPIEIQLVTDERLSLPSASAMPRIFACAGSFLAEQEAETEVIQLPDGSADAERGALIHKANETSDVSELDEDDVELVERVRSIEEAITADWATSTGDTLADIEIVREKRLWVGSQFSAQLDFLALNHKWKSALVIDLKSGRKKVAPPVRNHQLRACAVAVFVNYEYSPIRTAIVQPIVEAQSACDYNNAHLNAARDRIVERLEYIKQPNLPRTSGSHCEYCRALPYCNEARKNMSIVIRGVNQRWDVASPVEKLAWFKAAKIAEKCASTIIDLCRAELKANPAAIPGLVKAPDQKPRRVTDVVGLAKLMIGTVLDENADGAVQLAALFDFMDRCKVPISQVVDFYREKMPSGSKKEAEKFLANYAGDFIAEGFRSGALSIEEPET